MTEAAPQMSLTERQRAATRDAILEAAFRLLEQEPEVPFSHEAVAARAGISARTVYRHFTAQSDLTLALWQRIRDTTGTIWPQSADEILVRLDETFRQFDDHAALTHAVLAAARSIRHASHGAVEGRAAFQHSLADVLARLPADEGEQLLANCLAIYSAPYWQMLRDRGGLSPEATRAAAVTAMDALLTAARTRADALTPPR